MNAMETNRNSLENSRSGVIELSSDDYDLSDLAGEIARTLEACQILTGEQPNRVPVQDIAHAR